MNFKNYFNGVKWVDPRLLLDTYNYNHDKVTENYKKIFINALKKNNLQKAFKSLGFPLLVWVVDKKLYIGDGHHRVHAAILAGIKKIPVKIESPFD